MLDIFYFTFYLFGGCVRTQPTPCLRARTRLCAPGIVPCIMSFSRQLPCFLTWRVHSLFPYSSRLERRHDTMRDAILTCAQRHQSSLAPRAERITFKVATLTYRALHGSAPPYLASSFNRLRTVVSATEGRHISMSHELPCVICFVVWPTTRILNYMYVEIIFASVSAWFNTQDRRVIFGMSKTLCDFGHKNFFTEE